MPPTTKVIRLKGTSLVVEGVKLPSAQEQAMLAVQEVIYDIQATEEWSLERQEAELTAFKANILLLFPQ